MILMCFQWLKKIVACVLKLLQLDQCIAGRNENSTSFTLVGWSDVSGGVRKVNVTCSCLFLIYTTSLHYLVSH